MNHNAFLFVAASLIPLSLLADESLESVAPRPTSENVPTSHTPSTPAPRRAMKEDQKPGIFFTGDLLYWKAHEEDLEFALTGMKMPGDPNPDPISQGTVYEPDFKWSTGFRVGLGYTLPKRLWDLSVNWTRLSTEAKKSASHSGDVNVNSLLMILDAASFASLTGLVSASGKLHLHYNTVDFDLSRNYKFTRRTTLRPHIGVRTVWINQDYEIDYNYGTIIHNLKFDNDFRGTGIRGGLDTQWFFNPSVALFGNFAFSLIGGNFDVKQKFNELLSPATPNLGVYINSHQHFYNIVPEIDLALGVHLESSTDKDRYRFEVNLGWEFIMWFHQNMLRQFTGGDDPTVGMQSSSHKFKGNLSLQGITLGAKLHF